MSIRKKSSSNFLNEQALLDRCPITTFFHQLGGRWKLTILWQLRNKGQRFSDLQRTLPAISDRMLALQLKGLQDDNFITKLSSDVDVKSSVYQLSERGRSLIPILQSIYDWGATHTPFLLDNEAHD